MNTTYNYSEYSKIAKNKKLYTNSCKAVKIPNGDLFLICDTDNDTSKGKEAASLITDSIISYLSEKEYDNKQEALQDSLLSASVVLANEDLNDIKPSISAILLYNDEFYIAKNGDNQLFLFSDGKLNMLSNSQTSPLQLKIGDVLLSSSKGLTSVVDFETINATFKSNESVAQKNKNILDKAIDGNASTDVSIQTLEITNSKYSSTLYIDENLGNAMEVVVNDVVEKEDEELPVSNIANLENEITEMLTDKNETNMDNNEQNERLDQNKPFNEEELIEDTEDMHETENVESNESEYEEDEYEEDEEEKKPFPLKKILLFALPLLLIAAAIKYYPLLKGNKSNNQVTLEDLETKSADDDAAATIEGTVSTEESFTDENTESQADDVEINNTAVDNVTTHEVATDVNSSVNVRGTEEHYFIIGENNFNNNTYKTIYQYIKNTNTSLSIDDIIAVNPDYKTKRFGDKIYLK